MKYFVTRTIRTMKGKKQVTYLKGSKISETAHNNLSKRMQQYTVPAKNAPRAADLTLSQARLIVKQYVKGKSVESMIKAFISEYPDRTNISGLECQYRILAGCDPTTDDQGLQNPGKALQQAMDEVAFDRFNGASSRAEVALLKAAEAIIQELRG